MRLYFGCATILTTSFAEFSATVTRNNCFQTGLYRSEEEAVGAFIKFARSKYPGGKLDNAAAYQVTDAAVLDAAHYLEVDREKAN